MATNLTMLTVDFVRTVYSGSQADPIIQGLIDDLDTKYGACLLANYGDVKGSMLGAWAVNYQLSSFEGVQYSGAIQTERAPNGASTTYDTSVSMRNSQNFIEANDAAGCLNDLFAPTFGMVTINGGCTP